MFVRSIATPLGVFKQFLVKTNTTNNLKRYISADNNYYDIIIVGSGMIGSTLACTLGKNVHLSNKKILMLESSDKFNWEPKEQYSNRVVGLNWNTFELLEKIGAWEDIAKVRFGVTNKIQAWDGITDSTITFDNNDCNKPVMYVVENDLLLASVNKHLDDCPNITTINQARIKGYNLPKSEAKNAEVIMENGDKLSCKLLLGCDGANSTVRKAMGTSYISWKYKQTAVVATLNLKDTEDNHIAWQRFLPMGPIAFLPLKSNLSSLVWSTTPEHAQELLSMSPKDFVSTLNYHMCKIYNNPISTEVTKYLENTFQSMKMCSSSPKQVPPYVECIDENSRASFPLGFGHAVCYVDKGVALVGDAAHKVHPLAGQGVNLGFGDITDLNNALSTNLSSGFPFDHPSALQDYQTQRLRHNIPTMLAIDGLQKLYTTEFTPIVLMRSVGLKIVNNILPLKRAIVKQAMS